MKQEIRGEQNQGAGRAKIAPAPPLSYCSCPRDLSLARSNSSPFFH